MAGANKAPSYRELDVKESTDYATIDGRTVVVRLEAFDERSISVWVDGESAQVPLGHFSDRRLGNPPGDAINVVEIGGIQIGADVNRTYMTGTRYSRSLVNLEKVNAYNNGWGGGGDDR